MSKLQEVRGTPCKCSQQRSRPGLRLRLTALLVLIACVWWISRSLITSSALDNMWQSTSHTPVVEEVAGPRDICKAVLTAIFPSGVLQQLFECLPQSLPDIKQRRGSKASGFRKQCHEGNTTSSHDTAGIVYSSTCSSKLYLYFSWNAYFVFVGDPSYSLVLDWRRSKSTRRSIHMNEPK